MVEKIYTVRLYNGNELIMTYENVAYGTTITDLPAPTYNGAGNAEDYRFIGWNPMPENVTMDINCYAQFEFTGLYFRQLMQGMLTAYIDTQALTTIAPFAFACEEHLETVSILSLTLIPEGCFRGTPALAFADLPSVIAADSYAFSISGVMTELVLPELIARLHGITEASILSFGAAVPDWSKVRRFMTPTQFKNPNYRASLFEP